jgi:hypothetical protein
MAVADLQKAELRLGSLVLDLRPAAETVGFKDSAFDEAERPGAGPSHAFQETTPVDTVVIMIVQKLVILVAAFHFILRNACTGGAPDAAVTGCNSQGEPFIPGGCLPPELRREIQGTSRAQL